MIKYLQDKYGENRVAQIITFGYILGKTAIKDVWRVFIRDFDKSNKITDCMDAGELLKDELEEKEKLQKYYEQYRKEAKRPDTIEKKNLFEIALAVENVPRHTGVHAAGVIVVPDEITKFVPLKRNSKGDMMLTQFEYPLCEDMGLLKIDALGLKTLSVIANTLENIDDNIDPYNLPLDDKETFDLFHKGETTGVFQFSSNTARQLLKEIKPETFNEIVDINAMNRPGPLNNGFDKLYKENRSISKRDYEKIEYKHPDLEPILEKTYGVLLYQEQIMEIAQELAGYTLGEADKLRKGMGKKDEEVMNNEYDKFLQGGIANDYDREFLQGLWDEIVEFSSYGFNKSHSASYTLLSYVCAYLKAYYPAVFMASLMSSYSGDPDKVTEYMAEARKMGIDLLPPDINKSEAGFTVEDGKIRFGLVSVKHVGMKAIDEILQQRPFDSLADAYEKTNNRRLHKGVYDAMIQAGMFDWHNPNRKQVLSEYYRLRGESYDKSMRWNKDIRLAMEKEYLGFYVSGHPLDELSHTPWDNLMPGEEVELGGIITKVKQITTKNGNPMAFLSLETQTTVKDVVVFPKLWAKRKDRCEKDNIVIIRGKKDDQKDETSLIADDILFYTKNIPRKIIGQYQEALVQVQ